jgi:AbrB family looped-hinge helix DNA binding protein
MATTIQMRSKGALTIPSELRRKYSLDEGDVFSVIDMGDGSLVLVPRVSVVPKLVAEIQALRREAGLSLEELLSGLPDERRRLYEERLRDTE